MLKMTLVSVGVVGADKLLATLVTDAFCQLYFAA
jgi:hypothetical protein